VTRRARRRAALRDSTIDHLVARCGVEALMRGLPTARFRTIQVCPKDWLTLPLAGWKMRQTD
jgi:hypothetical protein